MPAAWTAQHVATLTDGHPAAPVIGEADIVRLSDTLDLWDAWPVQERDGTLLRLPGGTELWMALAAPRFDDPDERHGHARIHLFHRLDGRWTHVGPAMPDGFAPGSREWSGSAIRDDATGAIILYFTAAGRRDEPVPTFEQRMFSARATLDPSGMLINWRDLHEVVPPDATLYMATTVGGGIGTIKAFRDPAYFRDPADGRHHLFFAGSLPGSTSAFNGVVGHATAPADAPDAWTIAPHLISADTLNNELERPHMLVHGGRYYLFWSTQRHVFDPAGPTGPTGLYGMVADHLAGPWRPINGSGLVFANPASAPAQAYSWLVLPDLSVTSFIDNWGADGDRRFGGTFAPFVHIWLDDARAGVTA